MRGIEALDQRAQIETLNEVVAGAGRVVGPRALITLRIDEDVRLVRTLVDGGTADLRKPEGFGLRNPSGRRRTLDAAGAIVVRALPPRANVLEAEDPRLVGVSVNDRRADLEVAIGVARVVPVVALAAVEI